MPLYEYYCPRCQTKYEMLRPMSRSEEPGTCPQGHRGGARTVSVFAAVSKEPSGAAPMAAMPPEGGCACGGGGCGCGH